MYTASVGLVNKRAYGDVRVTASGNTAHLTGLNTLANRASNNGGSMQLSSDASASLVNAIASTITPSNNPTINATENPQTGGDGTVYPKKVDITLTQITPSYTLLPEPNYPTPGRSPGYSSLPTPNYPTPGPVPRGSAPGRPVPKVDKSIKSIAIGVAGSAALGGRGSAGGQFVFGQDGIGLITSGAVGVGTPTLGVAGTISISNAPSYLDLEGVGFTAGCYITLGGVDVSFGRSRSGDLVYVITGSVGTPGIEGHIEISNTNVHAINNIFDPFTIYAY